MDADNGDDHPSASDRSTPIEVSEPVNLTAAAGRTAWSAFQQALHVGCHPGGSGIEIGRLADGGDEIANDGAFDTVYLIASGYGRLHAHGSSIDCTAGDVIFVPQGRPHHFERLDGEIRLWRIICKAS